MADVFLGDGTGKNSWFENWRERISRTGRLIPMDCFLELEPTSQLKMTPPEDRLVSLSELNVADADGHDGWTNLTGACTAEIDPDFRGVVRNCALQAEYFRPDLERPVNQLWHPNFGLLSGRRTLDFVFPPLFSNDNPSPRRGALVVFFQLFTADTWVKPADCRRISNVMDALIMLQ